jgi:hypothetical protein
MHNILETLIRFNHSNDNLSLEILFILMHVLAEALVATANSDHHLVASELTDVLVDTDQIVGILDMDYWDLYKVQIDAVGHGFL